MRPCTAHLASPCRLKPPADSPPQYRSGNNVAVQVHYLAFRVDAQAGARVMNHGRGPCGMEGRRLNLVFRRGLCEVRVLARVHEGVVACHGVLQGTRQASACAGACSRSCRRAPRSCQRRRNILCGIHVRRRDLHPSRLPHRNRRSPRSVRLRRARRRFPPSPRSENWRAST